jgi:uncharacterized FlgJ-related protein
MIQKQRTSVIYLVVIALLIGYIVGNKVPQSKPINIEIMLKKDSVVRDTFVIDYPLTEKHLLSELKRQNVKHPQIVLAQAKLETGGFKSKVCKTKNNLFGIRKGKKYRSYNHWTDCVRSYKKLIQDDRYNGGDYYVFLKNINYAEDPEYINKLKELV